MSDILRKLSPQKIGICAALVVAFIDQAVKWWVYKVLDIASLGSIEVTSFWDIVLVWNRGVSYGLFQQDGEIGRWLLVSVSIIAAIFLAVWMTRAHTKLVGISLGLIIGGAIGNAIDRSLYGAVLDFLHFHAGEYSWYVFNIADAAIVCGVALLLYDALFIGPPKDSLGGE